MSNTTRISGIALLLIGLSLAIAVSLTTPRTARASGVLYAAPMAQGSGDCSSWDNACTLQTALTGAVGGDEIWVQAGVHYSATDPAERAATFALQNGVALYGGFAGTETSRDQRNWQANLTILSGDIDGDDNHGGDHINENASQIVWNNAYHVVTGSGTDNTAVLDGFVITAGQANGESFPHYNGGGMYNDGSSPTLTNVTFSGNSATQWGGGMYNYNNSSPTLTNVTFSGNSAGWGGGMCNYGSSSTLTDVTFSGNSAGYYGGGMYNYESSPTLTDVTFSGNTATNDGGGMYNGSSSPALADVTFSGNSAQSGGGMFNSWHSSPTLTDATFSGNSATQYGGGMCNYESSPTLTNVTFSGNSASVGGGMYNDRSSPTLADVTFSSNSAYWGGGMCNYNSSPVLTDVTFSGNTANDGGGMYNYWYSNPTLTDVTFSGNSAIWGGGMYNGSSSPTLTDATFSGNTADDGGGMYNYNSSPTLTNVILWGDSAGNGPEIYNYNSNPTISYSDIQGCGGSGAGWNPDCGTNGGGNIDADPLFVSAAGGNLRLQLNSPAIDAGNNAAVPSGVVTDLDGRPRFVDIPTVPDTGSGAPPIVDMGAYEAHSWTIYLPLVLRKTP